ncbi:MAG: aldehyde dehydrogenase family protein [Elusimicrobiota bacterium]
MELKVVNPYNQEVVCKLPYDDEARIDKKLDSAVRTFQVWRRLPLGERREQVRLGLEKFRRVGDDIAREVTLQMGKPIREARNEVRTFFERAEHMLSIAEEALRPDELPAKDGFHRRIDHVPFGVVFNLAAWNYPLIIPVNVVVPALLAGNVVLFKHSGKTPLCGKRFEQAFGELEPPGLVTNLILTHEMTSRVIRDRRTGHVAFTGSVSGGRSVYHDAAERLIDAGLELGGKDPAYVAEDADLDFTVANVVDGACYNAGQSCCSIERVYVHEKLYDEFLERARVLIGGYKLGDPLSEETTMGPLVSGGAVELLERQVKDALGRGARLLAGGRRPEGFSGHFFEPTLLADVPNDAEVMQEESFGPILPVMKVTGDEQALACMRDTRYGLTASVWIRDRERAERLARDIDAGTIYQNRADYLDPALPWTGAHDSGMGSTLSRYGFTHLTRRKSIHFRVKI